MSESPKSVKPNTPSAVDYELGWDVWGDMIRYSPAPFHRRRVIVDIARGLDFENVLDVGCGNGETLAAFAQEFTAELAGVDLSEAVINANRERFPSATFERLDLERGSLGQKFDLVVCSEVLEHCDDQAAAAANLRAMTSGHLIASVPAGPVFPIDRAMGHHAHFTRKSLHGLLESAGFDVRFTRRWGFPFHSLYKTVINLSPEQTMHSFAGGSYGPAQRFTGNLLRYLFYLNARGAGWQLFALASARRSSSN